MANLKKIRRQLIRLTSFNIRTKICGPSLRGCLIIASCIGGGWVSAFFVMRWGEWYLMKGRNVTVKKKSQSLFCTIVTRSRFY